jgi:hypothetical protein
VILLCVFIVVYYLFRGTLVLLITLLIWKCDDVVFIYCWYCCYCVVALLIGVVVFVIVVILTN